MRRIDTFDDWTDYFRQWQKDIGLDTTRFDDYNFEVKFGPVRSDVIEFGDYAGRAKWETALQLPDQRARDSLLHLIPYQSLLRSSNSENSCAALRASTTFSPP